MSGTPLSYMCALSTAKNNGDFVLYAENADHSTAAGRVHRGQEPHFRMPSPDLQKLRSGSPFSPADAAQESFFLIISHHRPSGQDNFCKILRYAMGFSFLSVHKCLTFVRFFLSFHLAQMIPVIFVRFFSK